MVNADIKYSGAVCNNHHSRFKQFNLVVTLFLLLKLRFLLQIALLICNIQFHNASLQHEIHNNRNPAFLDFHLSSRRYTYDAIPSPL